MKTLKLLGLGTLLSGMLFMTSCSKESTLDNNVKSKTTTSTTGGEENPITGPTADLLFLNGLPEELTLNAGVGIRINGEDIIDELGFKEFTSYLPVLTGETTFDFVLENGDVLTTTDVVLGENQVFNVVLAVNPETELPELDFFELVPGDLEIPAEVEDLLAGGAPVTGYVFNVLNLVDMESLGDGEMILGMDYITTAQEIISGLGQLPEGDVTEMIFGSQAMLENIDILSSPLTFEELIAELVEQGDITDMIELGGFLALIGLDNEVGGLEEEIGGMLDGRLGEVLPAGDNPLDVVSAGLLDNLPMAPNGVYTVVMIGEIGAQIEIVIIDHNAAGLE
ncbi:MAG: hypothetical protein ACJAY8_000339 [Sphingobacteriales bacterium]|jgi:hypothetical protein